MGRRPLLLFFAVLVAVAALPVRAYLTKPREVIASTPSAFTGAVVPLRLPAHGEACSSDILFDTDAEIARFGVLGTPDGPAPALEVVAQGLANGPYANRYRAIGKVSGGWTGARQLDVPLRPPPRAAFGTFCIRNRSGRAVDLSGTQLGRTNARPTVTVNGREVQTELELTLLERQKRSLLSRAVAIMRHASTLRPLGAWWWLLLVGAAIAVPVGVALAMRSALAADAAAPPEASTSAERSPSERMRARIEAIPGWAILGAVAAVATVYFVYWGALTHAFQNDEDQYVYLSRWVPHALPESLWNFDIYQRGLQRLEVWLLAVPTTIMDSPASLAAGRVLNTLAFVSTAIPVYLLGRGTGLRSRWAALPASLSVVVPWAVLTTSFLTENIAYPAFMWVVWSVWRTTVRPSVGADALALVLIFVAGLSRTALLLLAPLLPAVVLLHDLRYGAFGARARLSRTLRRHALVWSVVAIAAVVVVSGALGASPTAGIIDRLAGGYGTPFGIDLGIFLDKVARFSARTVVGTAFFPAAVAVPWIVAQIVRPAGEALFALALAVTGVTAITFYALSSAGFDERYIVYLAPLVFLPAMLAIARREVSPRWLGLASIALAVLLLRVPWNGDQGPYGFFVAPAETFYARAVVERLGVWLPGGPGAMLTLVPVGLAVAGVALAVALRRAPRSLSGWPVATAIALVAVAIVAQTQYALAKYVNSAGNRSGPGLRARAFADQLTPGGARIGEFLEGAGKRPEMFPVWQEVQFYNQRIDRVLSMGPNTNPVPLGDRLVRDISYDRRTGRLVAPERLPEYVVTAAQPGSVRLRGEVVHAARYIPVALMRIAQPATLAWSAHAFRDRVATQGPGTIRFYGTGLAPGSHCAAFAFGAPGDAPARWRVAIGRRRVAQGTLSPGTSRTVPVRLPRLAQHGFVDVRIAGAPQVAQIFVDARC